MWLYSETMYGLTQNNDVTRTNGLIATTLARSEKFKTFEKPDCASHNIGWQDSTYLLPRTETNNLLRFLSPAPPAAAIKNPIF